MGKIVNLRLRDAPVLTLGDRSTDRGNTPLDKSALRYSQNHYSQMAWIRHARYLPCEQGGPAVRAR
eukprot:2205825-Pyramimonas_sp.AAC.1